MEAYYTDLHIHTSEDADHLNVNYDVSLLINEVKKYCDTTNILISLTDHNTINKTAYKELSHQNVNFVVGVELHIRNYPKTEPYHCHAYFDYGKEDLIEFIDSVNTILDELYPKKMVSTEDNIPNIESISKAFDNYDFLLLPHGGQTHKTFDMSIPANVKFDNVMERSVYFNLFDGFTSRSNKGLEKTKSYFEKLGISEFTNLITCSDNYDPSKYPKPKSPETNEYIPTWMLSEPTISGLRLALSESMRLVYQKRKPELFTDCIGKCVLKKDNIDIDVELTPGLNVIIGESSSGKTLFIESLYNKLRNNQIMTDSPYDKYSVSDLEVSNPVGFTPHYISQNYISKVLDDSTNSGVAAIGIIKSIFNGDESQDKLVDDTINSLNEYVKELISCVEKIENYKEDMRKIPFFPRLIARDELKSNPFDLFTPKNNDLDLIHFDNAKYKRFSDKLDELLELNNNPYIDITKEIASIREKLDLAHKNYLISNFAKEIIARFQKEFDDCQEKEKQIEIEKKKNKQKLLNCIEDYLRKSSRFNYLLNKIANVNLTYKTIPIYSTHGHCLYIENTIKLNKEFILDTFNDLLKKDNQLDKFENISPDSLTIDKFNNRKVQDYRGIEAKVMSAVKNTNKKSYRIETNDNRDFNKLSPGWKTAIILDLIFGYQGDIAPIFIDQPEDNLANAYINGELVKAIKQSKEKRQILIVTHNATIPMLADAQNVIYCENKDGKIKIRSTKLEGSFEKETAIDCIARVADGGKSSIKKRFKKYNLKNYRERKDDNNSKKGRK